MKKNGWTLLETMIVISVIGIIASIAIPSYRNYIPRMRLDKAKNEILVTLRLARTQAIAEGQTYQVIFEKSTNTYRINPGGQKMELPEGVIIANSFDIIYEFYPDRTGKMIPCDVTIANNKGNCFIFHIIEATGNIEIRGG